MARTRTIAQAALALALLALLALAGLTTQAQPTEQEAKTLFQQLGCAGCHNGNTASDWDKIVSDMQLVYDQYQGDLDAYAQTVVYTLNPNIKFNTWDDLKQHMATTVGKTAQDQDIQTIFSYFEAIATGQITLDTGAQQPAPQPEQPADPMRLDMLALSIIVAILLIAAILAAIYYTHA